MVMSNPVPTELQGRPFVEQARALPARVALEAFFAAAAGFTDDSPARGAFPWVLEKVASASMVCQWAKQDQTFRIGHLDGIDVAAKDKRAVMGLKDHAWVITTFLEEVLDKSSKCWIQASALSAATKQCMRK
jgi:hypothetical protein